MICVENYSKLSILEQGLIYLEENVHGTGFLENIANYVYVYIHYNGYVLFRSQHVAAIPLVPLTCECDNMIW